MLEEKKFALKTLVQGVTIAYWDPLLNALYDTMFFKADHEEMLYLISLLSEEKQQLFLTRLNENITLFDLVSPFNSLDEVINLLFEPATENDPGNKWYVFCGLFFGYPVCCIEEFIASSDLPYGEIVAGHYLLRNKEHAWWDGSGYVPCSNCLHEDQHKLHLTIFTARISPTKFETVNRSEEVKE